MATALRIAIGLVLSLIVSPGLGRQAAHIEIAPSTVLMDERFHVAIDGLRPQQDVTLRVDGNRGVWHSSATFRSATRDWLLTRLRAR